MADIFRDLCQRRFILQDRGDIIAARNIRRRDDGSHPRRGQRLCRINADHPGMGVRAEHKGCMQTALRQRHVVEIDRPARNMPPGAVMADRLMHAAPDGCPSDPGCLCCLVHNASSRAGMSPSVVSAWSRCSRFAATRLR